MKIVPFFPNSSDNKHCLQACVKSVLTYYLPNKKFTNKEIDAKTGQVGGWSWFPPAICWLNELSLKVRLYCPRSAFNYALFAKNGMEYLKTAWGKERYEREKLGGSLNNIPYVQEKAQEMVSNKLWSSKRIADEQLSKLLQADDVLAVAKTVYPWLSGNYILGNSHYVLVIKGYSPKLWKVHDPGSPPHPNRKVPATINNHSLFGDIVLIKGNRPKLDRVVHPS